MTPDVILDAAAAFRRSYLASCLVRMQAYTESPIEDLFVVGLLSADNYAPEGESLSFEARQEEYGAIRAASKDGITVWPQASVGPYRADFLLRQHKSGKERWLAVECDGHAFHQRTKGQVATDKKRDRYFAQRQLPLIRFTGSEIYADPEDCAMQALDILWPVADNG